MPDVVDTKTRSRMMAGIRAKNTKPEVAVRQALHRSGYRFRLHCKNMPCKPDIVLPRHKTVIFVHGCFWHGHQCSKFRWPKTRESFWRQKILGNVARDIECIANLEKMGWKVKVVWECEVLSFEEKISSEGL